MDKEKDVLQDLDIELMETEVYGSEIEKTTTMSTQEDVAETSESNSEVTQTETMDYILVEEPEELIVEVDEAFVGDNGVIMPEHTHAIDEVEALGDVLDTLGSAREYYSPSGGYAEFQEWLKSGHYKTEDYYKNTGGIGFFVSLVTEVGNTSGGNTRIDICKKINNDNTVEAADVYGVTVANSGFCGYQDAEYNLLDGSKSNRNNDPNCAKVCLLGNVKVRISSDEHKNIQVGDYVVPNELGCAKKSDNNVGFKVISKGQIESVGNSTTAWYYVNVALVPQNDNIARVMAELEKTQINLKNLNIQLGTINGTMNDMYDINVEISDKFDGIQEIVNDNTVKVDEQLKVSQEISEIAKETVEKAEKTIQKVADDYVTAVSKADEARDALFGKDGEGGVLSDIEDLQKNMDILAQWPEGVDPSQAQGVAGFVAQADKNSTQLASLTKALGDNGADLTAIIQKIDENGAAIQHLVTHVDRYILGEQSPAEGLTLEQTSFIQPGIIYVSTKDHTETYKYDTDKEVSIEFVSQVNDDTGETLGYGASYIWKVTENQPYDYMWAYYKDVYFSKPSEPTNDDLWYCWQGEYSGDRLIHDPQTLYLWKNSVWVAVASIDDDNATSIGSVNQTAKNFQIAYTNMQGDLASLEVKVDEVSTTVQNEVKEQISSIHQTAERIMMGVYDTDDGQSTSLGLLLDGMTSTSTKVNIVPVKEVLEAPPNVKKYKNAPIWNGTEFVLAGESSDDGTYYFDPNDTAPFTYYCEAAGDKYYVYGISNVAMANLSTRVTNTESEVESWTRFQKGQNETITSIGQTSNETGAGISSMVYGDFRDCVEIKLELTDADKMDFGANKYAEKPKWDKENKKFVVDGIASGIEYCLSNSDVKTYYKLLYRDDEITGYEKYQMKSSPYSAIVQKVDGDSTSIGLVTGNDDTIGSLFINTINDKSEVLINADKIGIDGTTIFSNTTSYGTTTISGDFIKSGVITSNNYNGPAVYTRYGVWWKSLGDDEYEIISHTSSSNYLKFAVVEAGKKYSISPIGKFPDESSSYVYGMTESMDIGSKITRVNPVQDTSDKKYYITPAYSGYLIAFWRNDFELISEDEVDGTKFDLNNGTIYSRNLILDDVGNLTITGRINATSGYIGDGTHGFTIDKGDTYYYMNYQQDSVKGNHLETGGLTGKPGIYIGPDGIGAGNGRFYVDNNGMEARFQSNKFQIYTYLSNTNTKNYKLIDITEDEMKFDGKITAKGNWNFSNATISGLEITFG